MDQRSHPSDTAAGDSGDAVQTWQEIEDLVEEIARLSRLPLSAHQFHRKLLDHTVASLAAVGGAIWTINRDDQLELSYQINYDGVQPASTEQQRQHAQLIAEAYRSAAPALHPPSSGGGASAAGNPTNYLVAFAPVRVDDQTVALLEIMQRPGISPVGQDAYLRLLNAIAELAADFHQGDAFRQLRRRESLWVKLDQFAQRVHRSLDLDKTAFAIANDGRRLIGCDRLSVLIQRGGRCRLAAISGVDRFDRRSHVVRLQEQLAHLLVKADEPLWHDDDAPPPALEIETLLHEYLDASQARMLAVIPLTRTTPESDDERLREKRPQPLGALVVENFDAGISTEQRECVGLVAAHSRTALSNAADVRDIPLMPLWRTLARVGWLMHVRQLPKTLAVAAMLAAVVAALVFVETDFTIEARGQLQPARRQFVFAPSDGVIDQLHVEHGSAVTAGQPLVVLRQPQIDLEYRRVLAEMQTLRKQLSAAQTRRLSDQDGGPRSRADQQQLTAEVEQLKQQLQGLEEERKIIEQQLDQLQILSPIDGAVLTWNVRQLLEARPVSRGQGLLTIADTDGPWVLEVRVPDDQVGHVLHAQDGSDADLSVDFILETEPGVVYRGQVEQLAMHTDHGDEDDLSVLATVRFDRDEIMANAIERRNDTEDKSAAEPLRPGAGAIAHFQCGRRSIGYVWFRGLFETLEKWWF